MSCCRVNVGQASRLPGERASASGFVPSALPTEAGRMPALRCGFRIASARHRCAILHWAARATLLTAIGAPRPLLACAACFGKSDSHLAQGMNWGILTLLAVVVFVLGSIAAFFLFLARRAAVISQALDQTPESTVQNHEYPVHEPTHPRPLPGGEASLARTATVPLLGGVRGGFAGESLEENAPEFVRPLP